MTKAESFSKKHPILKIISKFVEILMLSDITGISKFLIIKLQTYEQNSYYYRVADP